MIELLLTLLAVYLLIKAICFIFKLTWSAIKVAGITFAVFVAIALISALL